MHINVVNTPNLTLAYMGDVVYELFIREQLVRSGKAKVNELHKAAIAYVRAEAQAGVLRVLESSFDPEEQAVVRRGRNAKSGRPPKNADLMDYRLATAFEALLGYLYLSGRTERLQEILEMAWAELHQLPRI